jgi:hypothetical protein
VERVELTKPVLNIVNTLEPGIFGEYFRQQRRYHVLIQRASEESKHLQSELIAAAVISQDMTPTVDLMSLAPKKLAHPYVNGSTRAGESTDSTPA